MFIIWREYNAWKPHWHRLYAYLAESHRHKGLATPRQKIITYLGSIPGGSTAGGTGWEAFWRHAHCKLVSARVEKETHEKAMRLLEKRITRPSADELNAILSEERAIMSDDMSLHGKYLQEQKCSDI